MSEEQGAGHGQPSVAHEAAAPEDLLVGGVCSQDPLVAVEHLMINVVQRGVFDELVLEDPLPLIVLQGEDLLAVEPHAPVVLPQEHLVIALAGDRVAGRCLDVQYEDEVFLARGINHGDSILADDGGRRTGRERCALEVLDVARAAALEARHLAVVLDADNDLAAGGVGERADVLCDLLVVLAGALPIEILVLLEGGEQVHIVCRYGLLHRCLLIKPLHAV